MLIFKFRNFERLILIPLLLSTVVKAASLFFYCPDKTKALPFEIHPMKMIDLEIPYKPLINRSDFVEDEKQRKENEKLGNFSSTSFDKFYLPDELLIEIFSFFNLKTFNRFANASKEHTKLSLKFIQNRLDREHRFKLNVPRGLALAVYGAFFYSKLDYSRFEGLNGMVIDALDFIGMNFFAALKYENVNDNIIYGFSEFMPHDSSLKFDDILDYLLNKNGVQYSESFLAFNYLARLVLAPDLSSVPSNSYNSKYFLPYTFQALDLKSNSWFSNDLAENYAYNIGKLQSKNVRRILWKLRQNDRKQFILIAFNILSLLDMPFKKFVSFLKILCDNIKIENFDHIVKELRDSFDSEDSNELGDSYKFVFLLNRLNSNSLSEFKLLLSGSEVDNLYVFNNWNLKYSKYFFQVTPEKFLCRKNLAVKYLLFNDHVDYEKFFMTFDDEPSVFEFCFAFFLANIQESRIDILLSFINYAMEREDFAVPKVSKFSAISNIHRLNEHNPEVFKCIVSYLRDEEKYLSFYTVVNGTKIVSTINDCNYRNLKPFIISHFDLLIGNYRHEEIAALLNVNQMNSMMALNISTLLDSINAFHTLSLISNILPDIALSFIDVEREWTYFELSIAIGNLDLAEFIINHPEFDKNILNHEIDERNGIDLIFENIYFLTELFDERAKYVFSNLRSKISTMKAEK